MKKAITMWMAVMIFFIFLAYLTFGIHIISEAVFLAILGITALAAYIGGIITASRL